jgi:hypothetical protein
MNVYGYVQQRKKIKNSPKRVIVRDFWTTVSLADVSGGYETALRPFFGYEIKGTCWLDEHKDAIVLLIEKRDKNED